MHKVLLPVPLVPLGHSPLTHSCKDNDFGRLTLGSEIEDLNRGLSRPLLRTNKESFLLSSFVKFHRLCGLGVKEKERKLALLPEPPLLPSIEAKWNNCDCCCCCCRCLSACSRHTSFQWIIGDRFNDAGAKSQNVRTTRRATCLWPRESWPGSSPS